MTKTQIKALRIIKNMWKPSKKRYNLQTELLMTQTKALQ